MSEEQEFNRRCTDCLEHSGIRTRVESHAKILVAMDVRLQRQEDRLFNILVGVMLCLITGAITMSIAIYTVVSNSLESHAGNVSEYFHTLLTYVNEVKLCLF